MTLFPIWSLLLTQTHFYVLSFECSLMYVHLKVYFMQENDVTRVMEKLEIFSARALKTEFSVR